MSTGQGQMVRNFEQQLADERERVSILRHAMQEIKNVDGIGAGMSPRGPCWSIADAALVLTASPPPQPATEAKPCT